MIGVHLRNLKNAPTQGSSAVLKGPFWPTLIAFIERPKSSNTRRYLPGGFCVCCMFQVSSSAAAALLIPRLLHNCQKLTGSCFFLLGRLMVVLYTLYGVLCLSWRAQFG